MARPREPSNQRRPPLSEQPPAKVDSSTQDSGEGAWTAWAASQPDIPKRQRQRAADAALAVLRAGGSAEQAVIAGKDAARQGYASYYADASIIVGAISVAIALATGGLSILFAGGTLFAGYQGLKSRTRHTQAIIGLVLGGVSVLVFVARLVIRYLLTAG
ncbi:MAG TPA: hypothetical protein VHW94_06475 [Candidatus Dormibacteraeota bacterium]|nr:hypothetical protein [Candidatus Dormibacteraeota bacterium]